MNQSDWLRKRYKSKKREGTGCAPEIGSFFLVLAATMYALSCAVR
jgi:hypothetical protein